MSNDAEVDALGVIVPVLEGLDNGACVRILQYLDERFGAQNSAFMQVLAYVGAIRKGARELNVEPDDFARAVVLNRPDLVPEEAHKAIVEWNRR